jgi:acyl-CoA synthetase (AMP-forming)/AMP-acid ligase II
MVTKTIPYSIAQTVRDRAIEQGSDTVLSFEGKGITYAEFDKASNRTANGLVAQGIAKGDRIAFLGKNSPIYFELIAAASKIGAVVTPLNWRLAGPELIYVLNDCRAKLIVVGAELCDTLLEIQASLSLNPASFVIHGEHSGIESYATWQATFGDDDPMLHDAADDEVVQLYTSGTTGRPKGAILTDRAILGLRGQEKETVLADWQHYVPGESALLAMPCFHIGGTAFGLSIIHAGAHAVVLAEYDPNETLALIEQYRIGKIFMVPAALQILLGNPRFDEADLSSLTHIFYGASPIPLELMRESIDRLGCGFVGMYGMTETGGTIVALPPENHDPDGNEVMRSVGKPLWGVEIKVIDESGKTVPARAIGEIATRSEKNMTAYWNLPEATQETIDDEGWLRTGDAGYLDENGFLYIHDRVKDMIISGGENVYPAEVENAIYSHPNVADVAVVGVPDDKWGEAIKAFVVVKEGVDADAQDIIAFSRTQIAAFKCPKSVDFIDVLPRNPSGKILRRELRQPFWEGKGKGVN